MKIKRGQIYLIFEGLEGAHAEEGRALLHNVAPNIIPAEDLDHAAETAVKLAGVGA